MDRIRKIRNELQNIACTEATKLWRLARVARKHGCSLEFITKIRNEAYQVGRINLEDLLDPFITWEFAFKY